MVNESVSGYDMDRNEFGFNRIMNDNCYATKSIWAIESKGSKMRNINQTQRGEPGFGENCNGIFLFSKKAL